MRLFIQLLKKSPLNTVSRHKLWSNKCVLKTFTFFLVKKKNPGKWQNCIVRLEGWVVTSIGLGEICWGHLPNFAFVFGNCSLHLYWACAICVYEKLVIDRPMSGFFFLHKSWLTGQKSEVGKIYGLCSNLVLAGKVFFLWCEQMILQKLTYVLVCCYC